MRKTWLFAALGMVLAGGTYLYGQQTWTTSVPVLISNTTQWGSTTVTAGTALSDAVGNPTSPLVGAHGLLWDTTQWARAKSAAVATFTPASTLTARNIVGAALVEKSSRWMVTSNPAAGSQATASIANEASVRHVADCVSFSAGSTTAPALTALTVNLRDGATGAGTIIWTYQVVITAVAQQNVAPHSICGLNLTGTTNTAMTLEYSAALANLIESVSVSGYNVI